LDFEGYYVEIYFDQHYACLNVFCSLSQPIAIHTHSFVLEHFVFFVISTILA